MSNILSMNPIETVVNSFADFPLFFSLFNGTTNAASTAAAGDRMQALKLFGVDKAAVVDTVVAARSRVAVKAVYRIKSDVPAEIDVTATGIGPAYFRIMLDSSTQTAQMHQGRDHYGKQYGYDINIPVAGSEYETVKAIYQAIADADFDNPVAEKFFNAVLTDALGVATLVLTVTDPAYTLKFETRPRTYEAPQTNPLVNPIAVLKASTTTEGFEGTGTYRQMLPLRLQTAVTNEAYMNQGTELAADGGLYSCLQFSARIGHPELGGGSIQAQEVSQKAVYRLWILENAANNTILADILTFLSAAGTPASSVTKVYTGRNGEPLATSAAFIAA